MCSVRHQLQQQKLVVLAQHSCGEDCSQSNLRETIRVRQGGQRLALRLGQPSAVSKCMEDMHRI